MSLNTRYDVPESNLCPGCGSYAPAVALCAACTLETARAVQQEQQKRAAVAKLPAAALRSWPGLSNPLMGAISAPMMAAVTGPITPPWAASNGGDYGLVDQQRLKLQLTLLWAGTVTALIAILLNPPVF